MEGVLGKLGGFDPMTQGLLSAAFRGLQMSGPSIGKPVSFGQIVGGAGEAGMNSYSQANKTQMDEAYRRRLMELEQVKTDMAKQQFDQQRRQAEIEERILSGAGLLSGSNAPSGGAPAPGLSPTSAAGLNAPWAAAAPSSPTQQRGSLTSLPPDALVILNKRFPGLVDMAKHLDTPTELKGGSIYKDRRTGDERFVPKVDVGMVPGPNGGIGVAPGALETIRAIDGAKEDVKADRDPYIVQPTTPGGTPTISTRGLVTGAARAATAPAPSPAPGPAPRGGVPTPAGFPRESRTGDAPGTANSPAKAIAILKGEMASPGADVAALEKEIAGHAKRGMLTKSQVDAIQPGNLFGPAGVPSGMSTDTANRAKAEGAAQEGKFKDDATRVTALEQKLPSLFSTSRRIDKLEALTKDDKTYAAAGAELKTQLGSISQAFGLKVNQAKTANSEEYLAHIAELMKDRLASKDYGAGTGVSNLDLLAASKPLPELARTTQGRQQIITALRADTQRAIQDSQAASDYFAQNNSLRGFRYPSESAEVKAPTTAKTVVKRGKYNGKNVVQYSDGSVSYE